MLLVSSIKLIKEPHQVNWAGALQVKYTSNEPQEKCLSTSIVIIFRLRLIPNLAVKGTKEIESQL